MATKIDKTKLAQTINDLSELDSETKSQLLQLIHERKQYGLVWEEHSEEVEQQMRRQLPVFVEDKSKFIDSSAPDAPNHILIEGDNLPALTALTYTHKEKIDVIYIDPPYNTGNKDFIYNDSFVSSDDDYRHSKWLSFMSKRLRIAKTLLSDKGVIFISIDDNEQAPLKMLCDEIFGQGNFVGTFVWEKTQHFGRQAKNTYSNKEYILCYSSKMDCNGTLKDLLVERINVDLQDAPLYNASNPNNVILFPINSVKFNLQDGLYTQTSDPKYTLLDPVVVQNGYNTNEFRLQFRSRWSPETVLKEYDKGCRFWIKSGNFAVRAIYQEGKTSMVAPKEIIFTNSNNPLVSITRTGTKVGTTEEGSGELNTIIENCTFSYPKPTSLIKYILSLCWNIDALAFATSATILDFFAGSGTTLHATMQLNAEDGGHRQCILITNNENNICEEVTYERNKRVIQGYTTPKGEQVPGLTANKLRYYRTDFVVRESTLTAKKQLMLAATDLLCIKESIYTECNTFGSLRLRHDVVRYFADADADAQMLIIYNPEAIDHIVAEIRQMDIVSPIRIYVFSANDYAYNADFEEVDGKVLLCALPAAIYNAYRKVLPKKQQSQDEPATTDTQLTFEEDTL